MVYDLDYREVAAAAIDTAYRMTAQGGDTPNEFKVPSNVSRITGIRIGLSAISADTIADVNCSVEFRGAGIRTKEGWFAGPNLSTNGAAATSGGAAATKLMEYRTNIPVVPGGNFDAYFYIYGTDPGTAHGYLEIEYDGMPGRIVDSDVREVALTAANTLVSVTNRGTGAAGDFKPTGPIVEIICGFAPTLTGHATDGLNAGCAVHLSGAGIAINGNYKMLSNINCLGPDTDVHGSFISSLPERKQVPSPGIAIKKGSEIRAQAQVLESTQAGNAIVGLCYGA